MLLSHDALISVLFCETDRAQRMRTPLSLVHFGIDQPGALRSRYGSAMFENAVDGAIRRVSKILRCYDSIGRVADEEFLILLPGCTAPNAVAFAERARSVEFCAPIQIDAIEIHLSACFGIAESAGRAPLVVAREAQEVFRRAVTRGPGRIECSRMFRDETPSALVV